MHVSYFFITILFQSEKKKSNKKWLEEGSGRRSVQNFLRFKIVDAGLTTFPTRTISVPPLYYNVNLWKFPLTTYYNEKEM